MTRRTKWQRRKWEQDQANNGIDIGKVFVLWSYACTQILNILQKVPKFESTMELAVLGPIRTLYEIIMSQYAHNTNLLIQNFPNSLTGSAAT